LESEATDQLLEQRRLTAQLFGGRGGFFRDRRVLLHHGVDLLQTLVDFFDAFLLFVGTGSDLSDHIVDLVDVESEKYFPEEMYIAPVASQALKTGCIVKIKNMDKYFIVLSPACDLAQAKTDRILVCLIENTDGLLEKIVAKQQDIQILDDDDEATRNQKKARQDKKRKSEHTKFSQNIAAPYYHYLPKTKVFAGGVINFRHLETYELDSFKVLFENPTITVASAFTKDIVARFSAYYARQGQPEFDLENYSL